MGFDHKHVSKVSDHSQVEGSFRGSAEMNSGLQLRLLEMIRG